MEGVCFDQGKGLNLRVHLTHGIHSIAIRVLEGP